MKKKLQVFISSTYIDLIDERQAAVEGVLDAGHIPAGMELFKAGNRSQLDTIYKWIDNSDVYMLILGGRYGSIEENSGKSYTQLEYEYAIQKDIPVFAVVLEEDFLKTKGEEIGEDRVFEKNHIEEFVKFKEVVMTKIIRKVRDSKDIKLAIHTTLNEFIEDYTMVGWVRANETEASVALLSQNNQLNIELNELHKENKKLKYEIEAQKFEFEKELAFEQDTIKLLATYQRRINSSAPYRYEDVKIEKDITWDNLFVLWAPYLMKNLTLYEAQKELSSALKDYMGRYVTINGNLFQTIKIQYVALGLIYDKEYKAVKGGTVECIGLTDKGMRYLVKMRAIKKC